MTQINQVQQPQKIIAKLLLNYRILHNLKQIDMAKLLRCTQSQYSLWETGQCEPNSLRERDILDIIK